MNLKQSSKAGLVAGLFLWSGAQAAVIDFQSLETPGPWFYPPVTSYTEKGYTFVATNNDFSAWATGNSEYAGSTALFINNTNDTATLTGTGNFNLVSIDLSELFSGAVGGTPSVTFTADSGHTQTFFLDGVFGFETFVFDSGFTNISSVSWDQEYLGVDKHQFDNVVIHSVPTYSYTGNNFITLGDQLPPSGQYTNLMSVTGSFTVSTPLAAMPLTDISASVLSYTFNDGRTTLTESNSTLLNGLSVAVDASGQITDWEIVAQAGLADGPGANIGDEEFIITTDSTGVPRDSGVLRECVFDVGGCISQEDYGIVNNPGVWSGPPLPTVADVDLIEPTYANNTGLHVHHQGQGGLPDDIVPVVVVGDPLNLDATLVDPSSLRFGPGLAMIDPASTPNLNYNHNNDGTPDALFEFKMSETGFQYTPGTGDPCSATPATLNGELSTGELFFGEDLTVLTNCSGFGAQCH